MAPKVFPYNFESFQGLDYRTTGLKSNLLSAQNLQNFQFGESYSIRGRPGNQLIALPGGFLGVTKFNYIDYATNTPTEELIAINDNLWKLNVYTQAIVRGASATWGYRFYLDFENEFRFEITEAGTPVQFSGVDYAALGTGLTTAPVTIMDLCESIDALANYSVTTSFEKARVNGTQTGVNTITVDAGHTYATNDEIEFFDFSSMKLVSRVVTATAATTITVTGPTVNVNNNQVLGAIAATPAACVPINTVSEATGTTQTFLFYYWTKVRESITSNSGAGISYAPFQNFFSGRNSSNWINPCFVPTDTSLHILTEVPGATVYEWENRPFKYDGKYCFRTGLPKARFSSVTASGAGTDPDGVYTYKAVFEYRDAQGYIHRGDAGVSSSVTASTENIYVDLFGPQGSVYRGTSQTNEAAVINGLQAAVTTINVDSGHLINPNDVVGIPTGAGAYTVRVVTATTSTSITISGATVSVADNAIIYFANIGYGSRGSASITGSQTNVGSAGSPMVVASHTFKVGDRISIFPLFAAAITTVTVPIEVVILGATSTTIWWDTSIYSTIDIAAAGAIANLGSKVYLYRTKASGQIYYLMSILPTDSSSSILIGTITDGVPDSALGEELIEPEIGKEWNEPPRASIATMHQGVMTYSRIRGSWNEVAFSDSVGGLEAVPLASNYFAVPGGNNGVITGLASDDVDSLIVTKERAIYRVDGALESNAFSILTIKEGDYGISSHASIVKVNGAIVGVGPLGFVAILGGEMLMGERGGSLFGFKINPAIIGNDNLRLSQAISYNDSLARHYHCFIPDVSGYASGAANGNSLFFVCDYEKSNVWFNSAFQDACLIPAGGFTQAAIGPVNYLLYTGGSNSNYYIPHSYHLSKNYDSGLGAADNQIPGCLFREMSSQYNEANRYTDHHLRVVYVWLTKDESLEDPESEKEFSRIKVWSLPGAYESRALFSLTVKSYKDFQSTTRDSEFTLSFGSASTKHASKELALNKCQAMAFEFRASSSATLGAPFISGISLVGSLPYRKEDIKK